ncbi:Dabb family protein [[Micrococcus luteus] ATCC 49442]|uniref:Dabb family protein n=1 Tax=[Micrococcus luteus] ATCC 49442 TaxID=2698727 RepID=UPI0013DD58FB|nr:Dabb family protein [[Micrococcus luteus] ATCC 49442]
MSTVKNIRHIALFRWNEGAAINPQTVSRELMIIAAKTAAIRFEAGPALGLGQPSFDFAVVADFATADDYLAYREDPEHSRYVKEVLRPAAARVAALQVETSAGDATRV